MNQNNNDMVKASKGKFVINIECRDHATWQGTVVWAEGNVTKQFRSALELLKLIDGALDAQEE